ncbi:MAG: glycosyltransferase family 2 protein [Chloroflexi bacterium]|nr:MAG: glycosyltransferase family 2 protein [Chloroflexota bacterium]
MLDVAVIIVSWNVRNYLTNCLRSVLADFTHSRLNGAVWVVDNASTDGTTDLVAELFPQVHLIANTENVGFGAANNQGMQMAASAEPRHFFLLNPDTVVRPTAMRRLVDCLDTYPNAGMAGPRLVYGDGRFQHAAFRFPRLMQLLFDLYPMPARLYESRWNGRYPYDWYRADQKPFPIDHPLGAAMMVKASVALATGGFDESFHMYCEEIDWCWRIHKAGWEIFTVPQAEIVHYGGESTSQIPVRSFLNLWQSRAQLYQKHYGRFMRTLARWLVQAGMHRRITQTDDPALKEACRQIIHIWQTI